MTPRNLNIYKHTLEQVSIKKRGKIQKSYFSFVNFKDKYLTFSIVWHIVMH